MVNVISYYKAGYNHLNAASQFKHILIPKIRTSFSGEFFEIIGEFEFFYLISIILRILFYDSIIYDAVRDLDKEGDQGCLKVVYH